MNSNPRWIAFAAILGLLTAACPEYYDPDEVTTPTVTGGGSAVGGSGNGDGSGSTGSGAISYTLDHTKLTPKSQSTVPRGEVIIKNRAQFEHAIDADCAGMDTNGTKIRVGADHTLRAPAEGTCKFWVADQPNNSNLEATVTAR